jgi:hypothetical protein
MSCTAGGIDRSACGVCAGPIAGRARSHRGFVMRPESGRPRGSPVGAGSTRDGGSMLAAGSGMWIGREGPIAGGARSYRGLGCGLDRVGVADLLWERVLPAMAAVCSPQDLGCGLVERAPSRAEPAPTGIWGVAWVVSALWSSCGSGFYPRWGRSGRCGIWDVDWQRGPHRGQSPLPQGFGVWRGSCRHCGAVVGAGSTRDGGGQVAAGFGMWIGREGPIAGRARSHRGLGCGLDRVGAVELLWERVLPAMGAVRSLKVLGCGLAERSSSRAEPAPTGDL